MNGKFHGGRKAKVVGIPGGTPKIEKKSWISNVDFHGGQCKKKENSRGVTVNLTGNPGGELQENRYPQQGWAQFFLEKPI